MRLAACLLALTITAPVAFAQEQEDHKAVFGKVAGGAVYDEMDGVDGSLVSETYMLTHLTCSTGSSKIRLLMPVSKDTVDGEKSSLAKGKAGWRIDIMAFGKTYTKDVVFKPIRDARSQYAEEPEITIAVGDPLWRALRDPAGDKFWAMNGGAGTNVYIAGGAEFEKFLAACHIAGR